MQVNIGKLNTTVIVPDWDECNEATRQYIYHYGWKQKLNDSAAPIARKNYNSDDEFETAVAERVADMRDDLIAGKVPGHRDPKATTMKKSVEFARSLNEKELAEFLAMIQAHAEAA